MLGATLDSNESALMLSAKTLSPSEHNTGSAQSDAGVRKFHQFASQLSGKLNPDSYPTQGRLYQHQ
jgi:hypothetical protein